MTVRRIKDNRQERTNVEEKRRENVKEHKKNLSRLEAIKSKEIRKARYLERVEREYNVRIKTLKIVIGELKKMVAAIAAKVAK